MSLSPAKKLQQFILTQPQAVECFPFLPDVPVYKVEGKIFALCFERNGNSFINLKCEPELAEQLRAIFAEVQPGYHMNKKHWNTINLDGELPMSEIYSMVDHSYAIVVSSLPKKIKQRLRLQHPNLAWL